MTIYQSWRCRHEPTHVKNERFVATFAGRILMAPSQTALQRKIDAAMEECFA